MVYLFRIYVLKNSIVDSIFIPYNPGENTPPTYNFRGNSDCSYIFRPHLLWSDMLHKYSNEAHKLAGRLAKVNMPVLILVIALGCSNYLYIPA